MEALLPFFIILFAGLFLSEFFHRVHLPWVIALVASGFLVGPAGLGIIEASPVLDFLSGLGLIFVMFMAGIETDFFHKSRQDNFGKAFFIALVGGTLSWIFGYIVAGILGLDLIAAVLLGIIFISSSVAIAVPVLDATGLMKKDLGHTILTTMIIQDVLSLVVFSFFTRFTVASEGLSPFLIYPLLVIIFLLLRRGIPLIRGYFVKEFHTDDQDVFEQELRAVLVLLIGIVTLFTLMGLHEILAAFLAGMILTDLISHRDIKKNIHALGYGLFIPIFFASIGMTTDFQGIDLQSDFFIKGLVLVVFGTICMKFLVSYLGSRIAGFKGGESFIIGAALVPQLTTTLALAFEGRRLGLFDDALVTALVLLSIVSVLVAPLLLKLCITRLTIKIN